MNLQGARVYVAGHTGLVGSAVVRKLSPLTPIVATHAQLDLTRQADTEAFIETHKPDVVILCAARVGGIGGQSHAQMLRDNLAIAHNVIDASARGGVKRLVYLGSSCIYPREAPQPITEDALLSGPLEPTNRGYAIAKIAGMEMARAYAQAGLLQTVSLMPSNLYGPGDTYDLDRSHVLPAMLRKLREAAAAGSPSVALWGTGAPLRELLHCDDLAQAVMVALQQDPGPDPINVGSGVEVTIEQLARMCARVVGYRGQIVFDATRPDGTPRKLLDSSRMRALGWEPRVELEDGIRATYAAWVAASEPAKPASEPDKPARIVAITSLSPSPDSAQRQRQCIASWVAAGCEVVALQASSEEVASIEQHGPCPGITFEVVAASEAMPPYIPISRMAHWAAARSPDSTLLLINADCELTLASFTLEALAARSRQGLCYFVRSDVHAGGRETRNPWGVDAFMFHASLASLIKPSEILCMGKPAWDWALPAMFVAGQVPVHCPTFRTIVHVDHAQRWSAADHRRTGDEAVALTGSQSLDAIFRAFTRAAIPIPPDPRCRSLSATPLSSGQQGPPAAPGPAGRDIPRPIRTATVIDCAALTRVSRRA